MYSDLTPAPEGRDIITQTPNFTRQIDIHTSHGFYRFCIESFVGYSEQTKELVELNMRLTPFSKQPIIDKETLMRNLYEHIIGISLENKVPSIEDIQIFIMPQNSEYPSCTIYKLVFQNCTFTISLESYNNTIQIKCCLLNSRRSTMQQTMIAQVVTNEILGQIARQIDSELQLKVIF